MKNLVSSEIAKLYVSGKSMSEIAGILSCSPRAVQYHLNKLDVKRRSRSEAANVRLYPYGDPFNVKAPVNIQEAYLFGLGVGLYWGEGNKANKYSVRLGNSDPLVLRRFADFLEKNCGVDRVKLRYGIQIFSDIRPEAALSYWSETLGVDRNQFFPKIVVTPARGLGTYRNKSRFGVVTLYFNNKRLKDKLVSYLK